MPVSDSYVLERRSGFVEGSVLSSFFINFINLINLLFVINHLIKDHFIITNLNIRIQIIMSIVDH
jgi:hypothetical protein